MLTKEDIEAWREDTLLTGQADELIAINVADTCQELFSLLEKIQEAYQGVGDIEGTYSNFSKLMPYIRNALHKQKICITCGEISSHNIPEDYCPKHWTEWFLEGYRDDGYTKEELEEIYSSTLATASIGYEEFKATGKWPQESDGEE